MELSIEEAAAFIATAEKAGLGRDDILAMANNRQVMEGFRIWCEKTHPNFFAPRANVRPVGELRRKLMIPARSIFTRESVVVHGGATASIEVKVSCLMGAGKAILGRPKFRRSSEDFLDAPIVYLCFFTEAQVLASHFRVGQKSLDVMKKVLAEHGLFFGMDPDLCKFER